MIERFVGRGIPTFSCHLSLDGCKFLTTRKAVPKLMTSTFHVQTMLLIASCKFLSEPGLSPSIAGDLQGRLPLTFSLDEIH